MRKPFLLDIPLKLKLMVHSHQLDHTLPLPKHNIKIIEQNIVQKSLVVDPEGVFVGVSVLAHEGTRLQNFFDAGVGVLVGLHGGAVGDHSEVRTHQARDEDQRGARAFAEFFEVFGVGGHRLVVGALGRAQGEGEGWCCDCQNG